MKCVCMAYLEAMLSHLRGTAEVHRVSSFARTVHLSYMPDEETGGANGMQQWVETAEFKALKVGFALDEGIANPNDEYTVFYGERGVWWMTVKAVGPTGHGSRFIENPATQKLHKVVQHFLDFRDLQEKKLLDSRSSHPAECAHARSKALELGDVISVNLTVLKAGVTTGQNKHATSRSERKHVCCTAHASVGGERACMASFRLGGQFVFSLLLCAFVPVILTHSLFLSLFHSILFYPLRFCV